MTPEEQATLDVMQTLDDTGVPWMLTGSLAANLYMIPRSTQDADFVLQADAPSWHRVLAGLPPGVTHDPQMRFETITATTRYDLVVAGTNFRIELFNLSDDAHDLERFRRRMAKAVLGRTVFVPTPEDVVIQKLRWAKAGQRRKDIDDAVGVLAMQYDALCWPYVEHWSEAHGTSEMLAELREEVRKAGL